MTPLILCEPSISAGGHFCTNPQLTAQLRRSVRSFNGFISREEEKMLFVRSSGQRSRRHIACLNQEWEKACEKNGFNFGAPPVESQLKASGNKCSHLLITFLPLHCSISAATPETQEPGDVLKQAVSSQTRFFSTLLTSWRQRGP